MRLKLPFSLLPALGFLFSAQLAFADAPIVHSFIVSAPHIISSQPLSFSWTIENGAAPLIQFSCPVGVRLRKLDGTAVGCNTAQTISTAASDGLDLIVTNTSGATRTLYATLTPVDVGGVSYPSLAQAVSADIYTDPEPLTYFSSTSASSSDIVLSYQPVTFSWSARGTTGLNIMMSCSDGVTATSSSYNSGQIFPCGMTMFSSDLTNTGSLTFGLYNRRNENADVKFTILPAMDTGTYDATHAKTVTITVKPYAPPSASVISFDGNDKVESGALTVFSWNVSGASAVNIKATCSGAVTFALNASTTPAACDNNYIFPFPLSSVSSTTLVFNNNSDAVQSVSLFLVPLRGDGTYDATVGKLKIITVYPKGTQVQTTLPVQPSSPPATPGQAGQVNVTGAPKFKFTKALSRGLSGSEVTKLQQFLKNYPDLYPEGLVTGYFGPATERAIKRFQEKYGIAKSGVAGYGMVGPKTRAKLNEF
jgi:hypothetical protein